MLGFLKGQRPIHGSEIKPVIRPIEKLLRIGIDQLRKKNAIKRGVLTNKDRLLAPDTPTSENVDDVLRNVTGVFRG